MKRVNFDSMNRDAAAHTWHRIGDVGARVIARFPKPPTPRKRREKRKKNGR